MATTTPINVSSALPFPISNNGNPQSFSLTDANGNVFTNASLNNILNLTATGASAGSLSTAAGHYVYNGTTSATYALPAETNAANASFVVVNASTNALTIAPFGTEVINGSTNTVSVGTGYASASFFNDPTAANGWIKR